MLCTTQSISDLGKMKTSWFPGLSIPLNPGLLLTPVKSRRQKLDTSHSLLFHSLIPNFADLWPLGLNSHKTGPKRGLTRKTGDSRRGGTWGSIGKGWEGGAGRDYPDSRILYSHPEGRQRLEAGLQCVWVANTLGVAPKEGGHET